MLVAVSTSAAASFLGRFALDATALVLALYSVQPISSERPRHPEVDSAPSSLFRCNIKHP